MSAPLAVRTRSAAATERLGGVLARACTAPMCFALTGPLGAGKTTFVRGLVRGLGGGMRVKSPTFALAHTYETAPPVHHIDLYRLDDPEAARALGLEEMVHDEAAFACVEWAERGGGGVIPEDRVVRIVFPANASRVRTLLVELPSTGVVPNLPEMLLAAVG